MYQLKTFPPKGEPFKLASVRKTDPPTGTDGSNWRRYVIAQGESTIVGYRQGSHRSVRLAIKEIVVQLNERRIGLRGRDHILISSHKKRA